MQIWVRYISHPIYRSGSSVLGLYSLYPKCMFYRPEYNLRPEWLCYVVPTTLPDSVLKAVSPHPDLFSFFCCLRIQSSAFVKFFWVRHASVSVQPQGLTLSFFLYFTCPNTKFLNKHYILVQITNVITIDLIMMYSLFKTLIKPLLTNTLYSTYTYKHLHFCKSTYNTPTHIYT